MNAGIKYHHDLKDLLAGASAAMEYVTSNLGTDQDLRENLSAQVTPECLDILRQELSKYSEHQRRVELPLAKENVFLDWIARATQRSDGTTFILYAAMLHPNWGRITQARKKDLKLIENCYKGNFKWIWRG
jgi:hypothetical protein